MKGRTIRRFRLKFCSLIILIILKIAITFWGFYLFGEILWQNRDEVSFIVGSNTVEGFPYMKIYLFDGFLAIPMYVIILIITAMLTRDLNNFYQKNSHYQVFKIINKVNIFIYTMGIIVILSMLFGIKIFFYIKFFHLIMEGMMFITYLFLFIIFDKKQLKVLADVQENNDQLNWEHDFIAKRKITKEIFKPF